MKNQIERAMPSQGAPDRREIVRSHPEYPRMVEAVNKHFPAGRANSGYAIEAIYDFVTARETGHVVLLEALKKLREWDKKWPKRAYIVEYGMISQSERELNEICELAEAVIRQAERT